MEVLGGIGLVLPALLRIWPFLTPLAACGLVIIMAGATVISTPMGWIAFSRFWSACWRLSLDTAAFGCSQFDHAADTILTHHPAIY